MAKKTRLNPYRILLQSIVLLLLAYLIIRPIFDKTYLADFEAYCPFGGIQAISSFLVSDSLACSMTTTQIFMGFALIAGVILISKLFCSHLCPIGNFTEWLSRKGAKLKMNINLTGWADRSLRVVKYSLLFVTFYFSVSSSELFCKTFDPYYAVFTGFSSDVVVSYALMALILAIPGSFFIRQFWCKYVCPLGAISNIFSHSYIFIGIVALYFLLTTALNINIHWAWLLGALTFAGFMLEFFKFQIKGLSFFRIHRNVESCTNCKLCDKACPMALKVSTLSRVDDIDCHLCGDCIASCPEKNTLQLTPFDKINDQQKNTVTSVPLKVKASGRSFLWIPAAAVVLFVSLGLAFSERINIPTISMKWGDEESLNTAGIYEQSGLTSIKCFGSSMAFANHMKEIEGVLGVETYVGDHSVKVWYNKGILSSEDIKHAIFTPIARLFAAPSPNIKEIAICETAIDNFFDPNDANLLGTRFSQKNGILGMKTIFGEPVHAMIFYDRSVITSQQINQCIEEKRTEWTDESGEHAAKTNFIVSTMSDLPPINVSEYLSDMYEQVEMEFNDYDQYKSDDLDLMEVPFNQGSDPELEGMPWYLLSHLSNNRGIVSYKVKPTNSGFYLELQYVKNLVSESEIVTMLNSDSLYIHLSDGSKQTLSNPYKFKVTE